MNATKKTTKKTTNLREGTSWLKRLDNQTHNVITQNRVGSDKSDAMLEVTKKNLHFQINWGSVYKGFFS